MTTQFITNQEKFLSDVINNILPSAHRLYFLIGYFYFSGFREVYKQLRDKEVKILVGLEVETDLYNKIKEYHIFQGQTVSRGKIRDNFYRAFVDMFSETDFFDSPQQQEAFKLFLEKIDNGTLEIRKTVSSNHAKLYIFENSPQHNQGGEFPGTVITGSSNLTRAGLKGQFEINVISRETSAYNEAIKIFNQLWEKSVAIADANTKDEFFQKVIKNIWFEQLPTPYLMYVRVLEECFPRYKKGLLRLPYEITKGRFVDLKYQEDAIRRAIDIINRHNGAIIADVVGLGKSIIASAVAHNMNLRAIVISPPHLVQQWDDYRHDFDFNAKIYSSGKIAQALEENSFDEEKLIIIDEAHKYRNEDTNDYANLHKLCQRNKVMLLTATPFNNRPQDVFSMIKLFQIPTRSTIQTVDNLSHQFKTLIKEYRKLKKEQKEAKRSAEDIAKQVKYIANRIRSILSPLVIRRSRLDLEQIKEYKDDLIRQKIEFPKVNDPQMLEYDLVGLSQLYKETLALLALEDGNGGFIGARYMPTNYIKDFKKYRQRIAEEMGTDEQLLKQTQVNLAAFMKQLLVRRFESSVASFHSSLIAIIESCKQMQKWYEKLDKIPVYKKGKLPNIDALTEATGEDIDEELNDITLEDVLRSHIEKGLWLIDKKEVRKQFIDDVRKDINLLETIYRKWFGNDTMFDIGKSFPDDPKLTHFTEIIKRKLKENPARKIVVFTEFADTANYLHERLKDAIRVFKYTSADANKTNKATIRTNFDAGIPEHQQKNDYDVLIATDAISEGFNLHRAGIVFNYDIPYNPTRVIQRVGRINRINKKVFDELFIYNFFPTATGERETRIREISTLKIAMIHALLGEDTKVLTKDEELQSYFVEQYRRALASEEELSPEAKYEDFIRTLRIHQQEIIEQAIKIPKRSRIKRTKSKGKSGVIVFAKKGSEYAFKFANENTEPVFISPAEAFELFEASASEQPQRVTEKFDNLYAKLKKELFIRKNEVTKDRGTRQVIDKLNMLIRKLPAHQDYLQDLLYVVEKLDALPEKYAKLIRAVEFDNLEQEIDKLKRQITHSYLVNIIEREQNIEQSKETLILSEELI